MFTRIKYVVIVRQAHTERNIHDILHQLYMSIDDYINNVIIAI